MVRRKVIVVAGLSGVGKSTCLKTLRRELDFVHLQASDLIRTERQEQEKAPVAHDLLRHNNIDDNQANLISGFNKHAPEDGLIVLDGHTIIDTTDGLVEISPSVFSAISVSAFVVLVDDVEKIALRRAQDTLRARPARSHEELVEQQMKSVVSAYRAALELNVSMFVVPLDNASSLASLLSR